MSAKSEPTRDAPALVSAAYRPENAALLGDADELERIVAAGPRGAVALAGLSVTLLLAMWFAFYLLIFLPRGAVG